jgi:glucose-1-phosphate cytidylyltransferase
MKVVLFCGGLGMRMRDYSQHQPKPMAMLRNRPILWHIMRWYAHWGHKDFVLCLGYRGEAIKEYFLGYNEALSNDFVLSDGGRRVELLSEDIRDWRITFVETGPAANIGERLKAVEPYLDGADTFLANYSDGLTDCPLPRLIERHRETGAVATFLAVRPSQSFHVAELRDDGSVTGLDDMRQTGMWINGGFFVLSRSVYDVLGHGEELVVEPFRRLISRGALAALRWEGFWRAVDTFKDLTEMEALLAYGPGPWEAWRQSRPVPMVPRIAAE